MKNMRAGRESRFVGKYLVINVFIICILCTGIP